MKATETTVETARRLTETSAPVTRRERGTTCDGNHRVTDSFDSARNRFFAAYRAARFQRRFA